jgi:hypothetical protein
LEGDLREDYLTDAKAIFKIMKRTFITIWWKVSESAHNEL